MSIPLLSTKLIRPPLRRSLVPRPGLVARLTLGLENPLILVSAPAGYGKTTLLSAWLDQYPYPSAWISLDEGDNDQARFLAYLAAALQMVNSDMGQAMLAMLQSPQLVSIPTLLSMLVNDLSQLPGPFVLVLDDYQFIQEPQVHQAVSFLLERQPWQMHLVIATRADPPLPLARLRAHSQLLELRAADLCFSTPEVERFFRQVMGIPVSKEDVETLAARTEGWIAGLQMAGVSLQGRQDFRQFVQDFAGSNRHVLDYLLEEVLDRQPQAVQEFLLETSILNDLCGPLCEAVTGREAAGQAMLEALDRANLFLVPLDDRRTWYRYHHLFSDLLRQRLQSLRQGSVSALHRRASAWFAENGQPEEAIRHAFSAGEYDRAAGLIERTADTSLMHGELLTFLRWVEQLPDPAARGRPLLCVYHAEALLLSGKPIDQAAGRLAGQPEFEAVQALMAAYRADVGLSRTLSERVLRRLPEDSVFLRGSITSALGAVLLLSGDVEPAIQAFQAAEAVGRENGNLMLQVVALSRLGQLHLVQAELHTAEKFFRRALELSIDPRGGYLPIASLPLTLLAHLLRERNDLDQALGLVRKALELIQVSGGFWSVDTYVVQAFVFQGLGDLPEALDAIRTARKIASLTAANRFDDLYTAAYEARLLAVAGELEAAAGWVRENRLGEWAGTTEENAEARLDPGLFHLVEIEQVSLARVLLARGQAGQALEVLQSLLPETEKRCRRFSAAENLALQSLAYQIQGETSAALARLELALEKAEPGGLVRIFVDEGSPMRRLLELLAYREGSRFYPARLLEHFGTMPAEPSAGIEPISERELEVLRLIAAGLSNREIAGQLVISLSTVKGHTAHIFGKLGVQNRTQAAARARELKLIR